MPRLLRLTAIIIAMVLGGCADSEPASTADDAKDARTVEINMVDIAFEPNAATVARGETVRFVFTNRGEVAHDAFIGDVDEQADHEAEMRERDEDAHGGHGGDSADAITVEEGDDGELIYTFEDAGEVEIGCHQPGHYEAGMKVTVEVA